MRNFGSLIGLLSALLITMFWAGTVKAVTYPTITIYLPDGSKVDIDDKVWKGDVYTALYDREVSKYAWDKDDNKNYVFFDKSLRGLNKFGIDFINSLKMVLVERKDRNMSVAYAKEALMRILYVDSDDDGYINKDELDAGSLPGFADDTPPMHKKDDFEVWMKYGVIIGMIASIFVMYFVFRK